MGLNGDGDAVAFCDIYECYNIAVSSYIWWVNWSCGITCNRVTRFVCTGWIGRGGAWLCLPSAQLEQLIRVVLRSIVGVSPANIFHRAMSLSPFIVT